jgi:hypothetical protein
VPNSLKPTLVRNTVAIVASAVLLSACSGPSAMSGSTPTGADAAISVTAPWSTTFARRVGGAPGTQLPSAAEVRSQEAFPESSARVITSTSKPFRGLYVSDLGIAQSQGGVRLLAARTYRQVGILDAGNTAPVGEWVDQSRNFYVANANGGNATEYAPRATSPTCTYSGAVDPTNVTTNKSGEVFVVDWSIGHSGVIDVYKHCQDKVVGNYTFGTGAPAGVTFDAHGNMFVMYLSGQTHNGALEEFKRHSKTPTPLAATVTFPGGLLMDKNQNLIAADQGVANQTNGAIDIIAPPYSTATPLVSGLAQPVWLSMNPSETLLFASSYARPPTVWVFEYPSGKLKATISAPLRYPLGVAASPDDAR